MAVTKQQRALLIVSSLSKNYSGLWRLFYVVTESAALATARLLLWGKYRIVVAQKGTEATTAEFLSALDALAKAPGISVVDVFLHLHGLPGILCFYDRDVSSAALRDGILALGLPEKRLRLCYNTGCFGDSQNWQDMLAAGFASTIGAKKVNATGAGELPVFCGMWRRGEDVAKAMRWADHGILRKGQDVVARLLLPSSRGQEVDSQKVIRGQLHLTISCFISDSPQKEA